MANILLIEEIMTPKQNRSSHAIRKLMEQQGHKVHSVMADGDQLLTPMQDCDIAIVDVGQASGTGYTVTEKLRAAHGGMGILLLAGQEETAAQRVAGLQRGADFCEARPEEADLLNAYIDVLLRRVAPDVWRLDTKARTLRAPRHDAVEINVREVALLRVLAHSSRHAADRCTIANAFGIDWISFDERVLEKTVSRLRRKWRESNMGVLPLRTLHGMGYCFTEAIRVH
ncbi:response regulator transcription factor [Herbaspirillum sp. AP02]|uniref:response regulator transcription factor n=1 Tax=unclassified Herbaspirillum TaxID=2624150 RepID=UPI0015D965C9|nr:MULTISPECIES: winged helix-turn-helix domain-containing protein [unclassified Herbaspirillum]MBG7619672.1 response regulator transcription factor [Herbaspirillum sp. AP02]NZD69573.1 response regulator transcription factor [Herbaspirillum sp. AP21]